jgi:hypothetical protein
MEKPAGKNQSGIPKYRQKDNVERSERNRLAGQRVEEYFLTYTVINIRILYNAGNFSIKELPASKHELCCTGHNINIDNSSSGRVEDFKYFETTFTNQNYIQEEIN